MKIILFLFISSFIYPEKLKTEFLLLIKNPNGIFAYKNLENQTERIILKKGEEIFPFHKVQSKDGRFFLEAKIKDETYSILEDESNYYSFQKLETTSDHFYTKTQIDIYELPNINSTKISSLTGFKEIHTEYYLEQKSKFETYYEIDVNNPPKYLNWFKVFVNGKVGYVLIDEIKRVPEAELKEFLEKKESEERITIFLKNNKKDLYKLQDEIFIKTNIKAKKQKFESHYSILKDKIRFYMLSDIEGIYYISENSISKKTSLEKKYLSTNFEKIPTSQKPFFQVFKNEFEENGFYMDYSKTKLEKITNEIYLATLIEFGATKSLTLKKVGNSIRPISSAITSTESMKIIDLDSNGTKEILTIHSYRVLFEIKLFYFENGYYKQLIPKDKLEIKAVYKNGIISLGEEISENLDGEKKEFFQFKNNQFIEVKFSEKEIKNLKKIFPISITQN